MAEPAYSLVLSCEHAGNEVPSEYRRLFEGREARAALESHRGWDPGAIALARRLSGAFGAPLVAQPVTRLLVECNRSLDHPALWSAFSRRLPKHDKQAVLTRFWHPHRDAVRAAVRGRGCVLHLGVHTFTPVWRGRARPTGIGVLYDPHREPERTVAIELCHAIRRACGAALACDARVVHLNRPYRGWTDGLTTTLRRELPADRYVGLELEVSQDLATHTDMVGDVLEAALRQVLFGGAGGTPGREPVAGPLTRPNG